MLAPERFIEMLFSAFCGVFKQSKVNSRDNCNNNLIILDLRDELNDSNPNNLYHSSCYI